MSLFSSRREYARASLDESAVDADPIRQFGRWYDDAAAGVTEPNAMTLATATPEGVPSARIVLLKQFDHQGFVFFSDERSQKGRELAANPVASLVFFWSALERQVRITGSVQRVSAEEADEYYASRPLGSRLSAWVSHQSQPVPDRAYLEATWAEMEQRFGDGPVPRPPYWGGFRVVPTVIEFWQGRPSRLHDRLRYRKDGDQWRLERLSP
jgi:pyridoxamine 5'-phosphate oxidase